MTHLSDFSYLQRVALEVYMGIFLFFRVWSNDRFRCLHPKRIFAGELRSIITVLYIMMLLMQTSWDVISTWIKYSEKFMLIPGTTTIITKPFDYWTTEHKNIAQAMDYVECVNLSMQTGVFFLLQCFWNYLSNTVAKKSFMSSLEFKFYIFWALGSVAVFPILQWYFRENESLRETVPQLAYSIEVIFTTILGVRSHMRFKRILNISRNKKHGGAIIEKLAYFKDMNVFLTTILFFYGISLGILCVDGLTTAKIINSNKFASDLLIANCNTCSILMWIVGISIFHPRRSNEEIEASVNSTSMTATATNNNNPHRPGGDIEISNDKFNGSSSFSSEGLKVNGHRLSQRITNFIENKNGKGAPRFNEQISNQYEPTSNDIHNSRNGSFLRPMSPVEVDFPSTINSQARSFTPTHQFTSSTDNKHSTFSRNIAVEDPYTNAPINFTMMEPTNNGANKQRFIHQGSIAGRDSFENTHRSASPMSTNSNNRRIQQQQQDYPMQTMSGAISNHEDFRFDPLMEENTYDYLGTPTKAKTNDFQGGGHQDWLGQSPDRRI